MKLICWLRRKHNWDYQTCWCRRCGIGMEELYRKKEAPSIPFPIHQAEMWKAYLRGCDAGMYNGKRIGYK